MSFNMVDNISTSSKSSGLLGGRLPEAVWRHFIKGGKISPGKHTAPAVTVLNPFQLDFIRVICLIIVQCVLGKSDVFILMTYIVEIKKRRKRIQKILIIHKHLYPNFMKALNLLKKDVVTLINHF